MSNRVAVCLCTVMALVALGAAPGFRPGPVLAASGTVSMESPLHDSPDPAAPVIALLPEGTVVSIEGPPVDGFYPVIAENLSGWMRGETVQVEKDLATSDTAEDMAIDPPLDESDETVPVEAPTELDPALSTTVEPAVEPASGDESVSTTEPVPADGMPPATEPVPVDAAAPASDLASIGDAPLRPTNPDGAVPPPDSAAPDAEAAEEPAIEANVTPVPVTEVAAVGPASVMVDAPILLGPGTDHGVIATAPAGSTVEKTGHVIDGYVTVQYAEVTGWLALAHLGIPAALAVETPPAQPLPGETAVSVEPSTTETPQMETAPTEPLPTETLPSETLPPEPPTVETPTPEASPAELAPIDSVPGDMAPIEAAPVNGSPTEVVPVDAT